MSYLIGFAVGFLVGGMMTVALLAILRVGGDADEMNYLRDHHDDLQESMERWGNIRQRRNG